MEKESLADRSCGPENCDGGSCTDAPDRTIGVLLVHGMGEQERGEHTEKVVRSLVASWTGDYEVRETMVRSPATFEVEPDAVPDGSLNSAQIVVRVERKGDHREIVDVHFHEVWWADLGLRVGFSNWARFLLWILRTPFLLCRKRADRYADADWKQRAKDAGLEDLSPRSASAAVGQFFVLVFFSALALMTVFSWGLLRRLLRRFAPSPVVLLQYLGDVQAYQEDARVDTGSGRDMALPPRVPIRRRMVQEMVAMAERGFDRWYVMAHSLGSVVAFNGLTEPDYILPDYLQHEHWQRLDGRFRTTWRSSDTKAMWPRRPTWLSTKDAVSREELFRNLGGLITYGCPLHLFVDLWPHIVPTNRKEVFENDFKWINVYSPFDPMSGSLRVFADPGAEQDGALRPSSFRYTGCRAALLAHVGYLKRRAKERDLGSALGKWWLRGEEFALPGDSYWRGWAVSVLELVLLSVVLCSAFSAELVVVVRLVGEVLDPLLLDRIEECCPGVARLWTW